MRHESEGVDPLHTVYGRRSVKGDAYVNGTSRTPLAASWMVSADTWNDEGLTVSDQESDTLPKFMSSKNSLKNGLVVSAVKLTTCCADPKVTGCT